MPGNAQTFHKTWSEYVVSQNPRKKDTIFWRRPRPNSQPLSHCPKHLYTSLYHPSQRLGLALRNVKYTILYYHSTHSCSCVAPHNDIRASSKTTKLGTIQQQQPVDRVTTTQQAPEAQQQQQQRQQYIHLLSTKTAWRVDICTACSQQWREPGAVLCSNQGRPCDARVSTRA